MIELLFAAHLLVAQPGAAAFQPAGEVVEMRRGRRSAGRSSRPRASRATRVRAPRISAPRVNVNVRVGTRPAARTTPTTVNNTTIIQQAPQRPATAPAPARRAAAPAVACPIGYQLRGRLMVAGTMQMICGNTANQCVVAATRAPFNCP